MVPSIIFGAVFLGFMATFLLMARTDPERRGQALEGAVTVFWFGLLFYNFWFPEAIFELAPWLPPNIWRTMVVGFPIIWGGIYSLKRHSPGVSWRQAFLFSPSMLAGVLIASLYFLNEYRVLDGAYFIHACSIATAAMGLLVVAAMLWRKEPLVYANLYQQIVNELESAQETAVKYPPAAGGIEVKSLVDILRGHKELLRNINKSTESADVFDSRYMPVIERYAELVHLVPASENDHHREVGGLLHHGLEVGYLTMSYGRHSMYGKELGNKRKPARERWLFACFAAGLCHDIGKVADDVRVTTDGGLVWSPEGARLMEWAAKNQVSKYYVDWQGDRHKVHESFSGAMLNKVLTDGDREYISEFDKELSKQVMMALSPSSGVEALTIRPYNIGDMVRKADQESVKEDKKKSRTPADLGLERPTPLIRHYHDGIQRLLKTGKWKINEPKAAAWVMGPDRGLYLVWPRCGLELYESLRDEGISGSPAAPEIIADILAQNDLLVPAVPGDYYWRIKPADIEGPALTVVRINPKFAPNFVNPFPASLGGMVQTDEGESSWTSVEGNGHRHSNPEISMAKADDFVLAEAASGSPGPKSSEASLGSPSGRLSVAGPSGQSAEKLPEMSLWRRLAWGAALICAGFWGTIGYLMYLRKSWYPEFSYPYYMQLLAEDLLRDRDIIVLGVIAIMLVVAVRVWPNVKAEVGEAERKAAQIKEEAEGLLADAKQEALTILADARREGDEIKKAAKEEAAEIKVGVRDERENILAGARQEADQEKVVIIKQAEADAIKIKSDARQNAIDLSAYFQAKAKNMGLTPAEWDEVLTIKQETQDKEKVILAQAEEKAVAIIAEAQDKAEEESEKILAQALKKSKEIEANALAKGADILGQALFPKETEPGEVAVQGNCGQSIQEELPEAEPSSGKDMADLGEVADQVAALEERIKGKILEIVSVHLEITKRELERKGGKSYYGGLWDLIMDNLLEEGKIAYDRENKTYKEKVHNEEP